MLELIQTIIIIIILSRTS